MGRHVLLIPLVGMVFIDAGPSWWFGVYVDPILGRESGLCCRRFGGTRCHHLPGNFDSEDVGSTLLQNVGISGHFHAVPASDREIV